MSEHLHRVMTSSTWPSSRASALLAPLFTAAVTVALLLCLPASSFAGADRRAGTSEREQGESSATALTSAGLLARGSGYGNQAGSKQVRALQLRLRRLGYRPGPIDGLFGPLTQASVERFQKARGLVADGVVGPRTGARLLAQPPRRPAAPHGSGAPEPGAQDRPAPDRPAPATGAPPRHPAPDAGAARPAARDPGSSDGFEPWLAALLGALAGGVLLAAVSRVLSRRRGEPATERRRAAPPSHHTRLNLGMVCAALLAVFAVGAALGALFATRAAPGERDSAEVASGALLSTSGASRIQDRRPPEPVAKSRPAVAARRRPQQPRAGGTAPAPTASPAPSARPAPAKPPESGSVPGPGSGSGSVGDAPPVTAPAPPVAPAGERGDTYTVREGDSLWPIAENRLAGASSDAAVARRVKHLVELNLEDRIASGDPDVLTAGEQLRLP